MRLPLQQHNHSSAVAFLAETMRDKQRDLETAVEFLLRSVDRGEAPH